MCQDRLRIHAPLRSLAKVVGAPCLSMLCESLQVYYGSEIERHEESGEYPVTKKGKRFRGWRFILLIRKAAGCWLCVNSLSFWIAGELWPRCEGWTNTQHRILLFAARLITHSGLYGKINDFFFCGSFLSRTLMVAWRSILLG